MSGIKIGIWQAKPIIAKTKQDVDLNASRIITFYNNNINADILTIPELAVCGYTPRDALLYPDFINAILSANEKIISSTSGAILLLPTITIGANGNLQNSVIVCQNGKIIEIYNKQHLPNNSVFDESRYFTAGNKPCIITINGIKCGILICEDIWHFNQTNKNCAVLQTINNGADCIIAVNASPYNINKQEDRMQTVRQIALASSAPVIYCNSVGAMDGIVFDGSSFAMQNNGDIAFVMRSYQEDFKTITLQKHKANYLITCEEDTKNNDKKCFHQTNLSNTVIKELYDALVFALREFLLKINLRRVVIGLSGGADSAFVLKIACDAIGAENIFCYGLKTRYTSNASITDAKELVANISSKINFDIIDIEPLYTPFVEKLNLKGLNLQNIQARVRGGVLMAKSAEIGGVVLTTGNKSEIACGYCTIYGDMCGAYNPIKDLYKTQIFAIMKHINKCNGGVFPDRIITKPPSAELDYNQQDSDFLPPYNILDAILFLHIELCMSANEIQSLQYKDSDKITKITQMMSKYGFALQMPQNGKAFVFNAKDVDIAINLLNKTEYKRRQAAPGTKVSIKSFEPWDWKFNI